MADVMASLSNDVQHNATEINTNVLLHSPDSVSRLSAVDETNADSDSEISEEEDETVSTEKSTRKVSERRDRKKVQRLSETWSLSHEQKADERAKNMKELMARLEAGRGTELGDIPLIENTVRKTKPDELKPLHNIIYGRRGSQHEMRSNIRKFKGFHFNQSSPEFSKKFSWMKQRPLLELRSALRVLNLEVSGSREQIASRLMDFLLRPDAKLVKYKGKVVKKPGNRGRPKKSTKVEKKKRNKRSSLKAASSEVSEGEASPDVESSIDDQISNHSASELSDVEKVTASPKQPKKRARNNVFSQSKKRRLTLDDSESDSNKLSNRPTNSKKKTPVKKADVSSDEDMPLSKFKPKVAPSDAELKATVITLLNSVNLEETSLKVIREKIFAQYPGIDLSGRKEFINTTVKEHLQQS